MSKDRHEAWRQDRRSVGRRERRKIAQVLYNPAGVSPILPARFERILAIFLSNTEQEFIARVSIKSLPQRKMKFKDVSCNFPVSSILISMKNWLLSFLCFIPFLFSAESPLKERLATAKKGDYIVVEANQMVTLLSIRSITPTALVFEEISAPLERLKQTPLSWPEWIKARAPGHTSWSMVELDVQNGEIVECYSFSRSTWIRLSLKESLFATLLQLPLKTVPPDQRRKIGPAPMAGEPDVRKVWNPPLTYEGQKLENARFNVFETTWPEDQTELSNKKVSLYFAEEKRFPFPFWIQVETSHTAAALRTIDSGSNLPSIYRNLPRR